MSPRYRPRWPLVVVWGGGFAIAAGALVLLGYVIGHGPPRGGNGIAEGLLRTVAMKGVAVGVAVVALTALVWCFRHLWLAWLAWRPGRIEVATFTAGSKLTDADVAHLTLRFRQRLAALHLQAPTPVPGAARGGDFLEVLDRRGVDARNLLGSALSLVQAAKPRHAWEVHGVLVERDERPRYGLTVQVLQLPDGGNPPKTHWTSSWSEAIDRGAAYATSVILPQTLACRTPWASWRRFVMPGELLGAYEEAVELERARRYDQALGAYYRASAWDPMNMALRLHIGQLQEKLSLHLDALSTYQGMLTVADQTPGRRKVREPRAARAERRRALLVARYRRIVLLGGSELAEQWRKTGPAEGPWSARDKRREELRDRLRRQLKVPKVAASSPGIVDTATLRARRILRRVDDRRMGYESAEVLLEEPAPEVSPNPPSSSSGDRFLFELRELFALAALEDGRGVLRRARTHLRDRRLVLSPESVRLTAQCIEVRLDWIQHHLGKPVGWPPKVEALDERVAKIERGSGFDRWHEHYNAACVYAQPLMTDLPQSVADHTAEDELREKLAEQAVQRLATATTYANSAYIAGRREWVVSEDQDLDGLRAHPRFKDFEATYFPAEAPTVRRPREVQLIESSRYVRDLLISTAEQWEHIWHLRGRTLDRRPDVHVVLAWWTDEREAWDQVRNVALDHRHWNARLELLDHQRTWGETYGFKAPDVSFPRYEEEPLSQPEPSNGGDGPARKVAQAMATRLADIGRTVCYSQANEPVEVQLGHIERWQSTLRQLDAEGRGPQRLLLAALCDHHAALWQLLREWLAAPAEPEKQNRDAFRRQVTQTARLWASAGTWWRNPGLVLAAVRHRPMSASSRSVPATLAPETAGRTPHRGSVEADLG